MMTSHRLYQGKWNLKMLIKLPLQCLFTFLKITQLLTTLLKNACLQIVNLMRNLRWMVNVPNAQLTQEHNMDTYFVSQTNVLLIKKC